MKKMGFVLLLKFCFVFLQFGFADIICMNSVKRAWVALKKRFQESEKNTDAELTSEDHVKTLAHMYLYMKAINLILKDSIVPNFVSELSIQTNEAENINYIMGKAFSKTNQIQPEAKLDNLHKSIFNRDLVYVDNIGDFFVKIKNEIENKRDAFVDLLKIYNVKFQKEQDVLPKDSDNFYAYINSFIIDFGHDQVKSLASQAASWNATGKNILKKAKEKLINVGRRIERFATKKVGDAPVLIVKKTSGYFLGQAVNAFKNPYVFGGFALRAIDRYYGPSWSPIKFIPTIPGMF
jgi:hypothetical protein